jgi:hypothetical protein
MTQLRWALAIALIPSAAAFAACGGDDDGFSAADAGHDAGTVDTETESETESESATESESETVDTSDTESQLAGPGEPCWKESYGDEHPNAGLPDCQTGYVCVGDATCAYCSETCDETGAVDETGGPFDGWCCGEMSNPCDPIRFWFPSELSALCVPRTAALGEECVESGTFPSADVRCAPLCSDTDSTQLEKETICEAGASRSFCTIPCLSDTDVMCAVYDEFADGCCAHYGVTYECTPSDLCAE